MLRAILAALLIALPSTVGAMDDGQYDGVSEGGSLSMVVKGAAIEISIGIPGCAGQGNGTLEKTSEGHWIVTLKDGDNMCELDIVKQGSTRFNVAEGSCSYFHGTSCRFDGFVYGP